MAKNRKPEPRSDLSAQELREFRNSLIERRGLLRDRVLRLSEQAAQDNPRDLGATSSMPMHLADLGSDASEQDQDLGLAERGSQEIRQIELALERFDIGSYGICETCLRPIPKERLQAIPYTALCTACQSQLEAA